MIYIIEMSLNGSYWSPLTGGEVYLKRESAEAEMSKYKDEGIRYRVARYERKP